MAVWTILLPRTSPRRVDLAQFEPSGPGLDTANRTQPSADVRGPPHAPRTEVSVDREFCWEDALVRRRGNCLCRRWAVPHGARESSAITHGGHAREADASNIGGMAQAIGAYQTREFCIRRSKPVTKICGRNGELFFMKWPDPVSPAGNCARSMGRIVRGGRSR
jgi:hypothetical protein